MSRSLQTITFMPLASVVARIESAPRTTVAAAAVDRPDGTGRDAAVAGAAATNAAPTANEATATSAARADHHHFAGTTRRLARGLQRRRVVAQRPAGPRPPAGGTAGLLWSAPRDPWLERPQGRGTYSARPHPASALSTEENAPSGPGPRRPTRPPPSTRKWQHAWKLARRSARGYRQGFGVEAGAFGAGAVGAGAFSAAGAAVTWPSLPPRQPAPPQRTRRPGGGRGRRARRASRRRRAR